MDEREGIKGKNLTEFENTEAQVFMQLDLPTLLDPSNEISALVRQHPHILLKKNLKLLSFAKSLPCLTTEYFANLERIQKFDILVMKHRASE